MEQGLGKALQQLGEWTTVVVVRLEELVWWQSGTGRVLQYQAATRLPDHLAAV